MSKKILALVIAASVLAGSAVANPVPAEKKRFEFWYGLTGNLGDRVKDSCTRFNASQDKFEAVCIGQGGYAEAVQNTVAAYRGNSHPAVVQVFDGATLDLMLSDAYIPVTRLMAEHGYNVNWSDYFAGISNYFSTASSELLAFPFNSSTAVLYLNRDALRRAGVEGAPQTWEDVEAAAVKLKAAGFDCPFSFDYDSWPTIEQFSAIHNQPFATRANGYDGLDAELLINRTKVVDHLSFFKRMADAGLFVTKTPQQGVGVVPSFASGQCQMMQTSIAFYDTIKATLDPKVQWDVAMLPVWKDTQRRNSIVGGTSLWVMKNRPAQEYDGVAAFFNFLAKPENVEWWSTVTGYIPVTRSAFAAMKAKGFYERPENRGKDLAIESLAWSPVSANTRGIRLGGFSMIRREMSDAMEAIFTNRMSVPAALDRAVTRSNITLRRFEKTYANRNVESGAGTCKP